MCALRSRLSSAGGSCGWQTAGHSSCRAQGPRSVGGTLPWLARPLCTASPSTCGLHHCPEIHLRTNLKSIYLAVRSSLIGRYTNWHIHSFIHPMFMLANNYIHGAASRHTPASISHTRPLHRSPYAAIDFLSRWEYRLSRHIYFQKGILCGELSGVRCRRRQH